MDGVTKQKKVRSDLRNTFYYYGMIRSITDPTQIIVEGVSRIVRSMIVVCEDKNGYRRSEVHMYIPSNFEHTRLVKMMECKAWAKFRFCINMKERRGGFYNNIFCMSVEPLRKKHAHLRQEINYDPYLKKRSATPRKIEVDQEGYIYPYDY